tara:strand:+ start:7456 stop:8022 length:567 start_codon:yes stop_codon:yes gene_type:complete
MEQPSAAPPPIPVNAVIQVGPTPIWVRFLAGAADVVVAGLLSLAIILTILIPVYFPDTQSILYEYANKSEGNFFRDTDLASEILENPRLRNMVLASQMIFYKIFFFYFFLSEWTLKGSSLGKKIFRITAVKRSLDQPLNMGVLLMRAWLKTVFLILFLPLLWITFLWVFVQPEKRTVHDLLTGTWVID